jgi:hypothetical protein
MSWFIRYSAIQDSYGIPEALEARIRPVLDAAYRILEAREIDVLEAELDGPVGYGSIAGAATRPIPPELESRLEGYLWVLLGYRSPDYEDTSFLGGAYSPDTRTFGVTLNFRSARTCLEHYPMLWDEWLRATAGEIESLHDLVVHEVDHLLLDARTGHMAAKNRKRDPAWYGSRGHYEDPDEINAQFASLAALRERVGPEAFDRMSPAEIESAMRIRFPADAPTLAAWVKRLMREGLLTTAMREAWNL